MTPEHPTSLRGWVEAALEQPAEERAAWLRESLPADDPRAAEILEIARLGEENDTFLERGPLYAEPRAVGSRIGDFTIVREIARGGMGVVYEATQELPRRRVALKVLPSSLTTDAARRRFEAEVQILGTLRHPSIAALHEAGIEEALHGACWFAMEYVEGAESLTKHADRRGLRREARLRLFLDVCDAVHHGHTQGVVHRDLKPDNVLVDETGRVKVIDFGVARVLEPGSGEPTQRTRVEEIVGTLAYMSPEQATGQRVDTRSDVYALGVVLYELLTSARPLDVDPRDLLAAARTIASTSPTPARHHDARLRGDLDAILGCCLEKDPERRYATVAALAADLRRHQAGYPIDARPPTLRYQLGRMARRHKMAVGAALVVVGTLVAATLVSLGFAWRAETRETEARLQRDRFETLFETQFGQSMEEVEQHARALLETLEGPRIAKQMLAATTQRLEGLERQAKGDATVLRGLADAYMALSRVSRSMSGANAFVRPEIRACLDRASTLYDQLAASVPEDRDLWNARARVQAALHAHAARYGDADAPGFGAEVHRILADDRTSAASRVHAHWSLAVAAQIRPQDAATRLTHLDAALREAHVAGISDAKRAVLTLNRGNARLRRKDRTGALADFRTAYDLYKRIADAHPGNPGRRAEVAAALYWIGDALMATGRPAEAKVSFEEANEVADRLRATAPGHFGVLLAKARALRGLGQVATALAVREHPKGSPEREAGIRAALAHWTEALGIYRHIREAGRTTRITERNARILEQMVEMNRRVVEPAPGEKHGH